MWEVQIALYGGVVVVLMDKCISFFCKTLLEFSLIFTLVKQVVSAYTHSLMSISVSCEG